MKSLLSNLTNSGRTELHQNKVYSAAALLNEKQKIASALPKPTVQDSGLDMHGKTIHVEIRANQLVKQHQDSMATDVEEAEKSPIILFKWGGTSTKPLHCQICDMAFGDGDLLREHVSKHESTRTQEQKPFPCRLCYKAFQSERSLERHQFVHSGQSMKRCKFCYKIFANKENLDKHMLMHNGQKIHQCPVCEKRFACRQAVETHLQTHANEKSFKCPICVKTFNRKDTMLRHQETHCSVKGKRHTCVECGKSFSFLFSLKKHVRSVHGGESDGKECEVCGKFIKNRENISRHMMIHANTRPHKCLVCDRAFVQKQHLTDHMAIHSSSPSFVCKICCNIFRHRRSLNRHLHKHYFVPSKGVFNCTKCNAQFDCKNKIREHILNSHDRILFCSMCKSKCQDENELAAHMLKEHSMVFKDSDMPELVHKYTETDETGLPIDEQNFKETNNDSDEQEAAQDLLRIQNFQSLSTGGLKTSTTPIDEDEISNEEQLHVKDPNFETATPINNTMNSECSGNEVDLNTEENNVIYIVCNNSQELDDQRVISKLQQQMESPGKIGEFVINRNVDNAKQSDIQTFYIPETITQSGSQIIHIPEATDQSDLRNIHFPNTLIQSGSRNIHIPEAMDQSKSQDSNVPNTSNQSGSRNIHISETLNQSGSRNTHIPETFNQSGSRNIHISETLNQSGSRNTHISETLNQSGSRNIHISETLNQSGSRNIHISETLNQSGSDVMINSAETANKSSVTVLKPDIDRVGMEKAEDNNELSAHVDNTVKTVNIAPGNHMFTDQTHYESDRSALIQTLIDYAEKIQEEEKLVEDPSETRI